MATADILRIYLDCCCFNRPFDDQSQLRIRLEAEAKLAIQEKIRSGNMELAWSYMMDFENAANPYAERRYAIAEWRSLASIDSDESPEIVSLAKDLQGRGLAKKDSIHLACAIATDCQIFYTTDDRVYKKREGVPEIAIRNPLDYAAGRLDPES